MADGVTNTAALIESLVAPRASKDPSGKSMVIGWESVEDFEADLPSRRLGITIDVSPRVDQCEAELDVVRRRLRTKPHKEHVKRALPGETPSMPWRVKGR